MFQQVSFQINLTIVMFYCLHSLTQSMSYRKENLQNMRGLKCWLSVSVDAKGSQSLINISG